VSKRLRKKIWFLVPGFRPNPCYIGYYIFFFFFFFNKKREEPRNQGTTNGDHSISQMGGQDSKMPDFLVPEEEPNARLPDFFFFFFFFFFFLFSNEYVRFLVGGVHLVVSKGKLGVGDWQVVHVVHLLADLVGGFPFSTLLDQFVFD
jgi:hypothetical protein